MTYLKRVNPLQQKPEFGFQEFGTAYLAGQFEPTERYPMAVMRLWNAGAMLSVLNFLNPHDFLILRGQLEREPLEQLRHYCREELGAHWEMDVVEYERLFPFALCIHPSKSLDLTKFPAERWNFYAAASIPSVTSPDVSKAAMEADQTISLPLASAKPSAEFIPLSWNGSFRLCCLYLYNESKLPDEIPGVRQFQGYATVTDLDACGEGGLAHHFFFDSPV